MYLKQVPRYALGSTVGSTASPQSTTTIRAFGIEVATTDPDLGPVVCLGGLALLLAVALRG